VSIRILSSTLRLRRIRRSAILWLPLLPELNRLAAEAGVSRTVHLMLSPGVSSPVTYGVLQPAIVLPEDAVEWGIEDLQRALTHEIEHVRRGDWLVQLLSRLACALYWFHPLAWIAARRLALESERACDDAVLRANVAPEGYAEQLVLLARRMQRAGESAAVAMAGKSLLFARVHSILDPHQRRGPLSTARLAGGACAALIVLALMAPLTTVPASGAASTPAASLSSGEAGPSGVLEAALIDAVQQGDRDTIDRLLSIGVSPDASVPGDGSPLIAAAVSGQAALVEYLLERGATIDMAVSGDGNPLIAAAASGHIEVVRLLLDRGAGIESAVASDENALIQASFRGRVDVVRLLLERGANVNARIGKRTALQMARQGRHREIERILSSAGAID
jgi:bla regulator protein blaR1